MHEVDRRSRREPQVPESGLPGQAAQSLLSCLRAEAEADLLGNGVGGTGHGRGRVEETPNRIQILLDGVPGEGLDQEDSAFGLQGSARIDESAQRIPEIVQTIHEADEIEVPADVILAVATSNRRLPTPPSRARRPAVAMESA